MKALVFKGINNVEVTKVKKPIPGPSQVLVKIQAASLNRRDQWIREGKYPNLKFNTVLGSDGCGTVEELGEGVEKSWKDKAVLFNPTINWGDNPRFQSPRFRILGMPDPGTLAEYIVLPVDRVHLKPDHLDFPEAAALPLGGLTAYRVMFTKGRVKKDQRVLITGIGGGVAQFCFLFAKGIGARVYVTSGSSRKIDKIKSLGADGAFNYKTRSWFLELKEEIGGFDLVVDSAGGDQFNHLINLLNPGGKLVFYGATTGKPSSLELYKLFWKQVTLQGSTMGNDEEFSQMLDFISSNEITPIIDSITPLEKAVQAFDKMKAGDQFGKLVIKV